MRIVYFYFHYFILFLQNFWAVSRQTISQHIFSFYFLFDFFLSLFSERVQRHLLVDESESMFSMWMAAEIDPWASTFRDRAICGLNSARLTLVKRERACISSRVSLIVRIKKEKQRFAAMRKQGLSETMLRSCVMIELFGIYFRETNLKIIFFYKKWNNDPALKMYENVYFFLRISLKY